MDRRDERVSIPLAAGVVGGSLNGVTHYKLRTDEVFPFDGQFSLPAFSPDELWDFIAGMYVSMPIWMVIFIGFVLSSSTTHIVADLQGR